VALDIGWPKDAISLADWFYPLGMHKIFSGEQSTERLVLAGGGTLCI
jgi:hypothetical protein